MKEDTIMSLDDMPIEDFRNNGYKIIDWIADYLQKNYRTVDEIVERFTLHPQSKPL